MKITMTTTLAGPQGTARPGTVLDVPNDKAKELLDGHYAREFDQARDAKSPTGIAKPRDNFEQ